MDAELFKIYDEHYRVESEMWEKWCKKHPSPKCHFTYMEIDEGLDGETLFVCKHCGNTVDSDGIKIEV